MFKEVFVRKVLVPLPVVVGAHKPEDLQGLMNGDRKAFWTGTLNTSRMLMVSAGELNQRSKLNKSTAIRA